METRETINKGRVEKRKYYNKSKKIKLNGGPNFKGEKGAEVKNTRDEYKKKKGQRKINGKKGEQLKRKRMEYEGNAVQ